MARTFHFLLEGTSQPPEFKNQNAKTISLESPLSLLENQNLETPPNQKFNSPKFQIPIPNLPSPSLKSKFGNTPKTEIKIKFNSPKSQIPIPPPETIPTNTLLMPTLHFTSLSLSISTQMAILCVCEDNNKENIPPSLSKQANTIEAMSKISAKRRRRIRYPLEDTTHLFHPPAPPTHSIPISNTTEPSVSRLILVRNPMHRKRRAENGPGFSMQMNISLVSLRKGFR